MKSEKKTEMIKIRLTEKEKQLVSDYALYTEQTISELVRDYIKTLRRDLTNKKTSYKLKQYNKAKSVDTTN